MIRVHKMASFRNYHHILLQECTQIYGDEEVILNFDLLVSKKNNLNFKA
jgi:hypothetical protein